MAAHLEPEQVELLNRLVTAQRATDPKDRQCFLIYRSYSELPGVELVHPAWPSDSPRVFEGDLDALTRAGAIAHVGDPGGFYVTNAGLEMHGRFIMCRGSSVQRIEATVRDYLNAEDFSARHPRAFGKWREAEELLWGATAETSATKIGHLAREAMQEFVTSVVEQVKPPDVEGDKAKTVARLRAVLHTLESRVGEAGREVLSALVAYWGSVSDLTMRQEHGGQKEGDALNWSDSRRVVFQLAVVMFEVDSTVRRVLR